MARGAITAAYIGSRAYFRYVFIPLPLAVPPPMTPPNLKALRCANSDIPSAAPGRARATAVATAKARWPDGHRSTEGSSQRTMRRRWVHLMAFS